MTTRGASPTPCPLETQHPQWGRAQGHLCLVPTEVQAPERVRRLPDAVSGPVWGLRTRRAEGACVLPVLTAAPALRGVRTLAHCRFPRADWHRNCSSNFKATF